MKEWVVIGLGVAAISWFFTDNRNPSSYVTIFLAGGVYVVFGAILAKFGYVRKTLKELRAEAAAAAPRTVGASAGSTRAKPAPTKRTSGGQSNRPNKKKR
ncbi:MAG: hypothetical protein HY828_15420 [Actinobacteria bacterium]|nr:hypothetical protein [Actinomycetota bacterium]